jgi:hypothetical protein
MRPASIIPASGRPASVRRPLRRRGRSRQLVEYVSPVERQGRLTGGSVSMAFTGPASL